MSKHENDRHCVKSVQIRSYFWSVFSCIRIEYGDLLRVQVYAVFYKIFSFTIRRVNVPTGSLIFLSITFLNIVE